MQQQLNKPNLHLTVRSHLRAGDVCLPFDSNCIAYNTVYKKARPDIWDNCNDGKFFAGDQCADAVLKTKNHIGLTCLKC